MKLKSLTMNLLGVELKIQVAAQTKLQETHPGKIVLQSIGNFLTPETKRKKIRHLSEL